MSIERQIDKRREELVQKIQALRSETMKHSHISTAWLPSDIAAEPGYKAEEDKIRAEMLAATEKENSLRETRNMLLDLFKQVEGVQLARDDLAC